MSFVVKLSSNLPEVSAWAVDVRKQQRFAMSRAINLVANAARDALRAEAQQVFDRPTPFIVNSLRVSKYSTRQDLTAIVEPVYPGGKGVDPQDVLRAEIQGGPRKLKRSERALQRAGVLPPGYYIAPGSGLPSDKLDAYGNVKGGFMVQILAYFQAFAEQGYKANMTAKRKAGLAKRGVTASGYKTIGGVEYFVAYGRLRGGKTSHLAPGIYSRTGTHGSDIRPVLMFIRPPVYQRRFDFNAVALRAAQLRFGPAFELAFRDAMRTARPVRPAR